MWPFTFLHLFLIFPERHRLLMRFPKFEYLLYVPALILITVWEVYLLIYPQVLSGESASWFPTYRELGRVNSLFRLICVVSLFFLILSSILKPFTSQARQRAKVIFWGVVLAFGPPVIIMMGFYFMKVNFPWNFLSFLSFSSRHPSPTQSSNIIFLMLTPSSNERWAMSWPRPWWWEPMRL